MSEYIEKIKSFEEEILKEPILPINDVIIYSLLIITELLVVFILSFFSLLLILLFVYLLLKDYINSDYALIVMLSISSVFSILISFSTLCLGSKVLIENTNREQEEIFDRVKRIKDFMLNETRKYRSNIKGKNSGLNDFKKNLSTCSDEELLTIYRYYKKSDKSRILNQRLYKSVVYYTKKRVNVSNSVDEVYEVYHKTKNKRNKISIDKVIMND